MTRASVVLAACGVALTCAGAQAGNIITYEFEITPEQEVGAVNLGEFTPSGLGIVVLDTDANMIEWEITYQGLTGPIGPPGAHFHNAPAGANGGIEIFISDGNPPEPASGVLIGSAAITDEQEAEIIAGNWYVNIHTEMNPAGEIRGQVIPTPAAIGLLGIGLAASRARRRH